MSNLTTALVIMLSINVIFLLGQASVMEINPEGTNFYDCQGSMLGDLSTGNCSNQAYLLDDTDPASVLPEGETSVSPETGNVYTDTFTTSRSWLLDSLGLRYVVNLLSAPYNILKSIGLPDIFAFAIGGLWYGITLFLIVAFILGRHD